MDVLSEKEAIQLFFIEAGLDPSIQASPSDIAVALAIVRKCGFLPIAVKVAGRLVRYGLPDGESLGLKDVSKHVVMA